VVARIVFVVVDRSLERRNLRAFQAAFDAPALAETV
jgi:hypothetical protein